jgi:hypothetical protein
VGRWLFRNFIKMGVFPAGGIHMGRVVSGVVHTWPGVRVGQIVYFFRGIIFMEVTCFGGYLGMDPGVGSYLGLTRLFITNCFLELFIIFLVCREVIMISGVWLP